MATFAFALPELGESIESGDVVQVLVAVGDQIAPDQSLLEIETDKAVVEVPSPVGGSVTAIHDRDAGDGRRGFGKSRAAAGGRAGIARAAAAALGSTACPSQGRSAAGSTRRSGRRRGAFRASAGSRNRRQHRRSAVG